MHKEQGTEWLRTVELQHLPCTTLFANVLTLRDQTMYLGYGRSLFSARMPQLHVLVPNHLLLRPVTWSSAGHGPWAKGCVRRHIQVTEHSGPKECENKTTKDANLL